MAERGRALKILAVADEESKYLWDHFSPDKLRDVDLILSCGDVSPQYLSFLATFSRAPVLYVHGNHDTAYKKTPPESCICVEDTIYEYGGVRVLGHPAAPKVGVVSFVPTAMDPGELCDALAQDGFALRAGLHCAPSVHQWLGTLHTGACRASVGIYNTETDVEALAAAVGRLLGPDRA